MNKMVKKIAKRVTGLCLAISVGITAAYFGSTKIMENTLFTSVIKETKDPPIIILDSGHGAYVLSIVISEYDF